MGTDSKNDMELIQRNLEQFLMEDLSKDPAYGKRQRKDSRTSYTGGRQTAEGLRGQNDRRATGRKNIDLVTPDYKQADQHRNLEKRNAKEWEPESWEPEEWESEEWEEEAWEDEKWDGDEWGDERENVRRTNRRTANTKGAGAGSVRFQKTDAVRDRHLGNQKRERDKTGRGRARSEDPKSERRKNERSKSDMGRAGQSKSGSREKSRARKKSKGKRFLLVFGILFVIVIIGWYALVSAIYGKMSYNHSERLAGTPLKSEGVYNVLLIGNDSRSEGDDGRSDAMILLSITKKTKSIQMISLLRDMYVEIPGRDGNRLNAAYAFGGPELLVETIKENLGIEVNRYVVVNFQAFANLVDAVGGVDLELTNEEVQWVNAYLNEYNMLRDMPIDTDYLDTSLSGMIHLNGPQALAYSRNRYIGTDFGRTERQRKILSAVIKKLPLAAFTNMGELVDGLFPNLTTNLTKEECMRLSLQAGKMVTYELVQSSIPVEGTYSNATIRGMAVLQVDFDANKRYLREKIYGE